MAPDPYDELDQGNGLLPPDGVAWPPLPVSAAAEAPVAEVLPSTPRRPDDAHIDDWRSMAVDAPDGYLGSASAPMPPPPGIDPWSVMALVCALMVPALVVLPLLPLLLVLPLPALAIAFGLTGRRVCTLDPTRKGKVLATIAVGLGAATLLAVPALLVVGTLSLGEF